MNPERNPDPLLLSDGNSATPSADWNEHEHVSDQIQIEAQKLVHLVGSPELARKSIDVVEQREPQSPAGGSRPTAPTTKDRNTEFLMALQNLETSLATPVVSGEMLEWVTTARLACEHVGVLLLRDIPSAHANLYIRIVEADPELNSRVEQLRAADRQLALVDLVGVTASFRNLLDQTRSAEQDEARVRQLREDVVRQAIAFVISARTQETAIGTWFSEAFYRDRGFGD